MIGQVRRGHDRPPRPGGVQRVRHGLKLLHIARQQRHVRALRDQGRRHGATQAG